MEGGMGSFSVIGVIGQHRDSPIQLFNQKHPGQCMGQGQIREAPHEMGLALEVWIQTIWPTNDKRHVDAFLLPRLHAVGQVQGPQGQTPFVQHNAQGICRQSGLDALSFGQQAFFGGLVLAWFCFDRFDLQRPIGWKALGIVLASRLGPIRHALSNGHHPQFHVALVLLRPVVLLVLAGVVGLADTAGDLALAGARLVFARAVVFEGADLAGADLEVVLLDDELLGLSLAAGVLAGTAAKGFGAPSFKRTGLSPQISSRW